MATQALSEKRPVIKIYRTYLDQCNRKINETLEMKATFLKECPCGGLAYKILAETLLIRSLQGAVGQC